MSRDEERLPALLLRIQQSGHDMMPIILRLPFGDATPRNTDDFLVVVATARFSKLVPRRDGRKKLARAHGGTALLIEEATSRLLI
jgi:hypothetical protein